MYMDSLNTRTLVWRSISRRPFRNIATVLCFAFVAGSLFSGNFLMEGAGQSLDMRLARMGADLVAVPLMYGTYGNHPVILKVPPSVFLMNGAVSETLSGVRGVEQISPQLYMGSLEMKSLAPRPIQLIGCEPGSDFTVQPWLGKQGSDEWQPGQVIIGSEILRDAGDPITLYGHEYTIFGRLDPTGSDADTSVFLHLDDAYALSKEAKEKGVMRTDIPAGEVSAVLIRVSTGEDPGLVASRIQAKLPEIYVILPEETMSRVASQLSAVTSLLYVAASVVTLVTLPLIALVSSMVAHERRQELGILRALGAGRGDIFRFVMIESLILAFAGGIAGVAVSVIALVSLSEPISLILQIPIIVPSASQIVPGCIIAMAAVVGIGGVAAFYPAFRSSRMEIYEIIRSGS